MKRIDTLTGVRAIAALWVLVYHFATLDPGSWFHYGPVAAHGNFGVDIFFVLSGLILAAVYAPKLSSSPDLKWYKRFLLRRLAKIYPLHVATLTLGILVAVGTHFLHYQYKDANHFQNTPGSAVVNLLLLHAWGVLSKRSWNPLSWSISAEWFAYTLMFVPVAFGMRKRSVSFVVGLAVALWLAMWQVAHFFPEGSLPELTTFGVIRIIPEFYAGYALYRLLDVTRPKPNDAWWIAGIAGLVAACYFPRLQVLLILFVCMLLTGLYSDAPLGRKLLGNRIMVLLGESSFSLYMIQFFPLIICNMASRKLHVAHTALNSFAVLFVFLSATISLSVLIYRYFEEPVRVAILHRFDPSSKRRMGPEGIPGVGGDPASAETETAAAVS